MEKKRYLVTYNEGDVSKATAMSILNVPHTKLKNGVAAMALAKPPTKTDVLHFEKLGISRLELSEEEALKLQNNKEVLAVEEDRKVHTLGLTPQEQELLEELLQKATEDDDSVYDPMGQNSDEMEGAHPVRRHPCRVKINAKTSPTIHWPRWKQRIINNVLTDTYYSLARHVVAPYSGRRPVPPIYQDIPWNIALIHAPSAWERKITGKGVNVAVIDTGIASHVDLSIAGGICLVPNVESYEDDNGHGTHCAGIIAARNNTAGVVGVAPEANLYAVKVLDENGSGYTSDIIAGLEWCLENNIHVASMSLGSDSDPSTAYATLIERCQKRGLAIVAASGNSFQTEFPWVGSPANSFIVNRPYASPIAVGAVNYRGAIASFSSRGGKHRAWNPVSCAAPGVDIKSTMPGNSYAEMSGTSMACPHVSGLVALLMQKYADVEVSEKIPLIKKIIAESSIDLGEADFDPIFGAGMINCEAATR